MKRTVVCYKAKPERIEENQRLIEGCSRNWHAKAPEDVRYLQPRPACRTAPSSISPP